MSTSNTLETAAPLSEAEQDQILAEAHFDVEKGLQLALELISRERQKRRAERLSPFPEGMIEEIKRIEGAPPVHRPRAEQLARIQELAATSHVAAYEATAHPGYPRWEEESLDAFVMVLEQVAAAEKD